MKKIIVLLTAMLMFTACSKKSVENDIPQDTIEAVTTAITNAEDPDFRNVKWGMSKEGVIANEGAPNSENEFGETGSNGYRLVYKNVSVTDYTAELYYYFENDALTGADYKFDCSGKTDLQINSMYYTLYKKYIEKYGAPESASFEMLNPNYKDLTEPPLVSDDSFSFENIATYKSNWSDQNGANISMKLVYSDFQEEGIDKHISFEITYETVSSDI
ncbi:MAG: membrane lipoprotein lipid attachment site-containing protein [Oscillospiraceae bacterium]|nr:membrane lipoprotein lipid attachment site-containing protein [Oscillospiraceae bacterium]